MLMSHIFWQSQIYTALAFKACRDSVTMSMQAGDHIHANEVILTFGMSNTTLLFLKEAAKKRDFQVRHDRLVQDAFIC